MSSDDLQSVVEELQLFNYLALVLATAVAYDYIITLPKEVNLIWTRSWSFVSSMFVLARYLGLFLAMMDAFFGTPFIPGPVLVRTVLYLLRVWGFVVFLAATDIVMLLRVHAMYNRSKVVLGVLLVFYISQMILYAVSGGFYNNPNTYMTMTVAQVLDMSFCNPTFVITNHLGTYKLIPRIILASLMFILSVSRLCTESYQTYKATKQWRANQYLQLLTKEGIIYFLGNLLYVIDFGESEAAVIVTTFATILLYILTPRFIMSVRQLYLRNLYGWDKGLDSGFGMWKDQSTPVTPSFSFGFTGGASTGSAREREVEMRDLRNEED